MVSELIKECEKIRVIQFNAKGEKYAELDFLWSQKAVHLAEARRSVAGIPQWNGKDFDPLYYLPLC